MDNQTVEALNNIAHALESLATAKKWEVYKDITSTCFSSDRGVKKDLALKMGLISENHDDEEG